MWLIFLATCVSTLLLCALGILCLATGLCYLSELMEEKTKFTIKVIRYVLFGEMGLLSLFWLLEGFPLLQTGIGILAHAAYLSPLAQFPNTNLLSIGSIASLVGFVAHNYFSLSYFAETWHNFNEVLGYFTLCVWLIPFSVFLLYSSTEGALPFTLENHRRQGESDGVGLSYAGGRSDAFVDSYLSQKEARKASRYRVIAPFINIWSRLSGGSSKQKYNSL